MLRVSNTTRQFPIAGGLAHDSIRNGSNRGVSARAKRRVFDVHDQGPSLRAIKTCPLVIRHDSILGGESLPMSLQPYYRSVNLNAMPGGPTSLAC